MQFVCVRVVGHCLLSTSGGRRLLFFFLFPITAAPSPYTAASAPFERQRVGLSAAESGWECVVRWVGFVVVALHKGRLCPLPCGQLGPCSCSRTIFILSLSPCSRSSSRRRRSFSFIFLALLLLLLLFLLPPPPSCVCVPHSPLFFSPFYTRVCVCGCKNGRRKEQQQTD